MSWTRVQNRKERGEQISVFDRLSSAKSNEDALGKISQSIFITNFPASCGKNELWELGSKHGHVVDVFIPNKMSKAGKRFAFMKFIRIADMEKLVILLREEWIGSYHLFARIARFDRKTNTNGRNLEPAGEVRRIIQKGKDIIKDIEPKPSKGEGVDGRSYAKVVNGDVSGVQQVKHIPLIMLESTNSILKQISGDRAAFIKVKYLHSIPSLEKTCASEGFFDVSLKYVGGLWVLMEFQATTTRNMFLKHKGMSNWIDKAIPWSRNFIPRERLIWLDIEGIPLSAWSLDSIKRIARVWEDVVFWDEEEEDNCYSARVCVESLKKDIVMETVEIDVEGKRYDVRVKEVTGWKPEFKKVVEVADEDEIPRVEKTIDNTTSEDEDDVDDYVADITLERNQMAMERNADDQLSEHAPSSQTPSKPPGFDHVTVVNEPVLSVADDHVADVQQNAGNSHSIQKMIGEDSMEFNGDNLSFLKHTINPENSKEIEDNTKENDGDNSVASSFRSCKEPVVGFSILQRLEETIDYGKCLGINMEGCREDMERLIDGIGGARSK